MFELRSVSVGYGERAVLQGVSFTAQAGRITALIGPNGCGKRRCSRRWHGSCRCGKAR